MKSTSNERRSSFHTVCTLYRAGRTMATGCQIQKGSERSTMVYHFPLPLPFPLPFPPFPAFPPYFGPLASALRTQLAIHSPVEPKAGCAGCGSRRPNPSPKPSAGAIPAASALGAPATCNSSAPSPTGRFHWQGSVQPMVEWEMAVNGWKSSVAETPM